MGVLFTNNAATTLAANLNNSATSIAVTSTSTFPSISGSNYFYATFDDGTNNEVVKVTGISSNTWTIVRAQDNTTARAFSSGDTVELRLNVALLNDALGDAATFARDSFTGDGSDTTFTLSQTAASENNLIVFIEGVFQTQSAYSLSGTTLTFSAAPANGREIIVYSTQALSAGTVTTASIVDANITTAKLAADAVTGAKIADNAIDSEHYTDGSIDLAHMSANSVDSDQYVDASIDTAHITDANITTAKLANDAVTAAKLADDSVVTANITDANVTTAKIADDQITLAKLAGLARGKIIYGDSSGNPAALAVGSAGTVLTSDGTDISWAEEVATNYLPLAGGTMTGNIAHAGNFTIDAGGDISLDADGGDITLKDGGTEFAHISNSSSDLLIQTAVADKDIKFAGTDGSTGITALTLDMSDSGKATFNNAITAGSTITGNSGDTIRLGSYGALGQTGSGQMTILGHNAYVDTSANNTIKAINGSWYATWIKQYYNHGITFHTTSSTVSANDTLLDGTGANTHERMRITNDGKIGIGTTTPQKDFVVSNAGAEGFEIDAGAATDLSEIVVYNRSGAAWNTLRHSALAHEFYVSGSEKMKIDSAGRVGIGKSPAVTLDVAGNANLTADDARLLIAEADGTDVTGIGAITGAGVGGCFLYNHGGTATVQLRADATAGFINNGANFGIGTTSPAQKLEVSSSSGSNIIKSTGTVADGYRHGFEASNTHTGGTIWSMGSTNNSDGYFGGGKFFIANETMGDVDANTAAVFVINGSGQVGIGETSPDHDLHIKSGSNYTTLNIESASTTHGSEILMGDSSDADYGSILQFASSAGEGGRMRFIAGTTETMNLRGGKVGIGTASPSRNLTVSSSGQTDLAIIAGTSSSAQLQFGDSGDDNIGQIEYNNSTNDMKFSTNATERMVILDTGEIGIGTTSPSRLLDINSTANNVYPLKIRGDIDNNGGYTGIVFGYESDTTAYEKAAIHVEGTSGNVQPDMHFLLHSGANNSNATISDARLSILNGGNVGIGTVTPAGLLDCNGTSYFRNTLHLPSTAKIQFVGGIYPTLIRSGNDLLLRRDDTLATIGTWNSSGTYTASDERHKENITTITGATAKVKQLRGVTHTWKAALQDPDDTDAVNYGLIAQEVETVIPELVHTDNSDEEYKSVSYEKLVPLLIETIKELEARITTLEG